eukprot:CAMPEP_0171656190 /NCGR_PEP_ID=MMETSP0990-20121206/41407_1 /TAXON_ID=483369 /ORGANISM="non described non described, Strain CCMP2098" /LENGTH=53 /DNA_ID=CAMNT_0012236563 /DNA_START=216 /DNA_END=377 /DNA_ORIENTATION=-
MSSRVLTRLTVGARVLTPQFSIESISSSIEASASEAMSEMTLLNATRKARAPA